MLQGFIRSLKNTIHVLEPLNPKKDNEIRDVTEQQTEAAGVARGQKLF